MKATPSSGSASGLRPGQPRFGSDADDFTEAPTRPYPLRPLRRVSSSFEEEPTSPTGPGTLPQRTGLARMPRANPYSIAAATGRAISIEESGVVSGVIDTGPSTGARDNRRPRTLALTVMLAVALAVAAARILGTLLLRR